MILPLPSPPWYQPFDGRPFKLSLATRPLELVDWIEIDTATPDQLRLRRQLLETERQRCFVALPGSEEPAQELLEMLAKHLAELFPGWFTLVADRLHDHLTDTVHDLARADEHPLATSARLVGEDLCLMRPDPAGYRLDAAVVCFPSRWRVWEKLGATLREIHAPVPYYDPQVAEPSDRLLEALKVEKPVWRLNWSLHDSDVLFQPTAHPPLNPALGPDNALASLWLRVERQTLRRLPRTGWVLFTIRTHLRRLDEVCTTADIAGQLAATLRGLPPETRAYKSYGPILAPLLAALDRRSKAGEDS
ncbi:MAG: DUF3445 domain-containing protein [Pirellulales bacterium]|nr:DUF3445 domain-containing protein [Pirellulales bacterium]